MSLNVTIETADIYVFINISVTYLTVNMHFKFFPSVCDDGVLLKPQTFWILTIILVRLKHLM
jgi:hypothetical protein